MEAQSLKYSQSELLEAKKALSSTLAKCEKINQENFKASQKTLLQRRIEALKIALSLLDKELTSVTDS